MSRSVVVGDRFVSGDALWEVVEITRAGVVHPKFYSMYASGEPTAVAIKLGGGQKAKVVKKIPLAEVSKKIVSLRNKLRKIVVREEVLG